MSSITPRSKSKREASQAKPLVKVLAPTTTSSLHCFPRKAELATLPQTPTSHPSGRWEKISTDERQAYF